MEQTPKYPKFYSLGEEIANACTHGVGALFAVAASVLLIVFSAMSGDPWKVASSCIYGASMILLFTMSTLYHSFPIGKTKAVFRVFDHASIFILIAGTYTPFTLVTLRGTLGWIMFSLVWASAIVGVTLNAISVDRFQKLSLICYLASGWCIVFAIRPLMAAIPFPGLVLLVTGGLSYTIGVIFFKLRNKYMHSIWHLFVLAGSILHFLAIFFYVVR